MLSSNVALLAVREGHSVLLPWQGKGPGPLALPSAEASEITAQHLTGFQKHTL